MTSCSQRGRVPAAGAAESRYDSRAQVTGARTYQRRCVNAGPKGSTEERAPPLGNQPENWWAERPSFVSGKPVVCFNAAGPPVQVSQEFYMVSA